MSAKLLQQERREHKIGFTLSSHTREIHSDMIKGLLLKGPKYFAGIFEADFRGVLKWKEHFSILHMAGLYEKVSKVERKFFFFKTLHAQLKKSNWSAR